MKIKYMTQFFLKSLFQLSLFGRHGVFSARFAACEHSVTISVILFLPAFEHGKAVPYFISPSMVPFEAITLRYQ